MCDAIDAHPWVGAQLSREPWQPAVLQILGGVGGQLQVLGVPERAQFDCAAALVNCILGLAGRYAAGARLLPLDTDRASFLENLTGALHVHDVARPRRTHQVAQLRARSCSAPCSLVHSGAM